MADNVTADAGSGGAVFATDDVSSVHYPISKITIGALDAAGTLLTGGNGAADAGCLRVTVASDSTGVLSVDDNGGALTVDWNGTAPPIGAGLEATALRVTVATDSTGVLTVDGTVTANLSATDNAVLDNIQTAVELIDNAVNGTNLSTDWAGTAPPIGAGLEATALRVTLATDSTGVVSVDDNGGSLTVDGTVTANLSATDNAVLDDIAAQNTTVAGAVSGSEMQVDVVAALPTGTNTIGAVNIAAAQTLATVTTVTTVTTLTGSGIAHDAADSGNPHKIGAKATTSLSAKTMVADNDRTDLFAGTDGTLLTQSHCLEDVVQERDTNTDGASTAFGTGLAAPGAGIRLWIRNVTISNSSASFCTVDLRDGAAGSVLWTFPVPATGGVTHRFDPPLQLTANTALAYDASAATTTLSISANGFKSKV